MSDFDGWTGNRYGSGSMGGLGTIPAPLEGLQRKRGGPLAAKKRGTLRHGTGPRTACGVIPGQSSHRDMLVPGAEPAWRTLGKRLGWAR
jgi:hypothetical protein